MAQRYGIMEASACTLRCDLTPMARIQRESLGVSGRVGGSTRSARGVGMPYHPAAAFLLQHRCPAADEVECATFKIGFESVPKDRPRHRIRNVWLYLERPVPEVLHLRDFRDKVMVAVVGPAAIDSSALDYGELRACVEGIQRSKIAGFGRLAPGLCLYSMSGSGRGILHFPQILFALSFCESPHGGAPRLRVVNHDDCGAMMVEGEAAHSLLERFAIKPQD